MRSGETKLVDYTIERNVGFADHLVYDVYGLTAKEIKIAEEATAEG